VKPDINSIEVHPQLSHNRDPGWWVLVHSDWWNKPYQAHSIVHKKTQRAIHLVDIYESHYKKCKAVKHDSKFLFNIKCRKS
jgi:hypothetical protein